jgi:hypothetical protein
MADTGGAVERPMKVPEVILRALSGQLTWPPMTRSGTGRATPTTFEAGID